MMHERMQEKQRARISGLSGSDFGFDSDPAMEKWPSRALAAGRVCVCNSHSHSFDVQVQDGERRLW
jgi:hypothetical protein